MTFFIRRNTQPERRAALRLVVKAGSIDEADDQRGLAHLLEHMAFNGSTHFKSGELVDYLESIGARFGPDVNAYTSFDETVYMLDLPELSIGGGLGVAYVEGEDAPSITEWGTAVVDACRDAGITARVLAEPGRSIVAQAALTLYTVGTVKEVPGVRTYVSVDGGMSDNPRPVLYGSGYEALLPRAADADRGEVHPGQRVEQA